jgi:hypothetical protein
LKRGTPDNPKTVHLAELLNINRAWAVGILEMLWHFTAKFCPCGDIGRFTDKQIAEAVAWERPTGERGVTPEWKLSDALVTAKWLDRCTCHRLVVHDWSDHADQSVERFLARRGLVFVHTVTSLPLPMPKPLPLPMPHPSASPPVSDDVLSRSVQRDSSLEKPPVAAAVSTEVQDGNAANLPNGHAVDTPTKKKLHGTKADYELWQREQEAKGRVQ